MFVAFFIKRPIFSTVIALVIVLAGVVCIPILPVALFPQIVPPTVQVSSTYTGASAEVVEQTVTSPIEEQINGVEGMIYMSSTSSSDGSSTINVTFEVGYDLDIAAVDVQNRVAIALPRLPEDVSRYGVTTKKQSTNLVLAVNLLSPDNSLDMLYLSNYADINIVDELKRLPGVGDVTIMGERKYSMRFWLNPDKLASMNLATTDVVASIRDQNLQVAAGAIGQPPGPSSQTFQYTILTKGRLAETEEFENIIIKTRPDGSVVRMKDVGRVELGAENYNWFSKINGQETAMIGVYQLPDANSVDVAKAVYEEMENISKRFPVGMSYQIPYDTTVFVIESIKEVINTLLIAIVLVFLVIYVFLQNWRSTLIPAICIPVSLIGTFGLLMALGFSINTLTLFGLVLAIGTVVDDSIVVVENISRIIEQDTLSPMEASIKGMAEVVGPVIATSMVLFAVLVPVAFMPGITGQLYKQFVLTIACAVGVSTITALTLSPAMCALMLRPLKENKGWFFEKFNKGMDGFRNKYMGGVHQLLAHRKIVVMGFLALVALTYYLFTIVPTGFVPDEDQGYFFVLAQGPDGSALARTGKTVEKIEKIIKKIDGVEDVLTIGGYNIVNSVLDPSSASLFVVLKPWGERKTRPLSLNSIMNTVYQNTITVNEAIVVAFNPPPINGLSSTGGFQYELQDYQGGSLDRLDGVAKEMMAGAKSAPELLPLSTSFKVNYPQLYIDLDRTKAKTMGVAISDVFSTLQTYLGSIYVNDFNKFGRIYRVFAQAENSYRLNENDISRLYVRNIEGDMVPVSAMARIKKIRGVQAIQHYNIYRSVELNGGNAQGFSSGQAIKAMDELSDKILPGGFGYQWSGVAFQENKAGAVAPLIFTLALAFVFLFLAAQYESWSLPLVVMLAVPLAILGALGFQWMRGLNNDVYCQIGLVMLIGLASKNAILIVEFAKAKLEEGLSIEDAALTAARIRLRPILMTALSFIFGVIPLVVASGAGAASRHSLGTTVFGGMIASTFLSLLLVPVLFVINEKIKANGLFGKKIKQKQI